MSMNPKGEGLECLAKALLSEEPAGSCVSFNGHHRHRHHHHQGAGCRRDRH